MSLSARLLKAETTLPDVLLRLEIRVLAVKSARPVDELMAEARDLTDRYWYLAEEKAGGMVDIEPVLRAMAEAEGFEYDELEADVRRILRRWRRRERRRR